MSGALLKLAEEHEQAQQEGKKPFHLNKAVAIAGLKSIAAAGLGTAAGAATHMGLKKVLEHYGWPHMARTQHRVAAAGALGTAIPLMYTLGKRLNREYLEDAYERSQTEPTGSLRLGGAPAPAEG